MWSHIFLFGSLPRRRPPEFTAILMFEFWREATATSVPGLLCQSGRARPENFSILSSLVTEGVFTWENSHRREFHTGMTFWFRIAFTFHISLFEGTLHVDKIHVWFKIANITHALPVPVYRQTDFTPKRVVVSRLHDTVARFLTGAKFSPRYNNRGELTPGWLGLARHFVVVSRKQM